MYKLGICRKTSNARWDNGCVFGPQEIIKQLIENSSTFTNKTGYAQDKYIKKKKQK